MHAVAEAGQNMQMHRQIEILRCGPETFVMIRRERQTRDGAPARSSCRRFPLSYSAPSRRWHDRHCTWKSARCRTGDPALSGSSRSSSRCRSETTPLAAGIFDAVQPKPQTWIEHFGRHAVGDHVCLCVRWGPNRRGAPRRNPPCETSLDSPARCPAMNNPPTAWICTSGEPNIQASRFSSKNTFGARSLKATGMPFSQRSGTSIT